MTQSLRDKMRDVNSAELGDIVTLTFTPWRVIGFIDGPAVLLERVGCEETPYNQRTHATVVKGSSWSSEWKLEPKPDRAAELVERWYATITIGTYVGGTKDQTRAFARWLISEGIVL